MKLILFGASGMVGAGVLREALQDPTVEAVLSIGRRPSGVVHAKLQEWLLPDLAPAQIDEATLAARCAGYDACIWAIGISAMGQSEASYASVTERLTLAWAARLLQLTPTLAFCYCSAAGVEGAGMWARVRRRVEQGLQTMPFRHVGVVRPSLIRPGPGIRSRTRAYQMALWLLRPCFPLLTWLADRLPGGVTTSERLGRAMLRVVAGQSPRFALSSRDINRLGA